jgi:phage baseplate assembly protein W
MSSNVQELIQISDEIIGYDFFDSVTSAESIVYKTLNQSNTSDDTFLFNMNAVLQSFYNALNTERGERLFRPEYGASLRSLVLASISESNSMRIKQMLIVEMERWEPRIKVNRQLSRVIPKPDINLYEIYLVCEVVGIGNKEVEMVFTPGT